MAAKEIALATSRLVLRPLEPEDEDALVAIAGQRRIADTTISVPHPFTSDDARRWIAVNEAGFDDGSQHGFAIAIADAPDRLVGYAGLHHIDGEHLEAELSFWIGEAHAGRGLVTEAAERLIAYAFEDLELNRLCAFHMVRNPASARILSKLGFVQEGQLRQRVRKWDTFEDVMIWARLRSDAPFAL